MGQFDFQQSTSPLLMALAQAPQQKQNMDIQAEQNRRDRLNSLLNNMQQFGTLAWNIQSAKAEGLQNQQTQSQMAGQQQLQDLIGQQQTQQARPVSSFQFGPNAQQPTFGQTPQGVMQAQSQQPQIQAALLKADPSAAGQLAKQQFETPDDRILKDAKIANYSSLIGNRGTSKLQSKTITYDGKPMLADYDSSSGTYYKAGTKETLNGNEMTPGSIMSPIAEIRRQNLINSMNMKLPELVNPARFGPSTVAGKAANIVQNADSYLGQADNIINGKVIPDKQVMTTLGIDAARTLTQTGVVSEKTINDLIPQTAKGRFADWQSFMANNPVGKDQLAFVKNLSMEVKRQRDQKQAILDRTVGGNLSALNELKRLSPQDWHDGLYQNGLDVDAARQGHFKLRPEILSSFYGTQEIPGVTGAAPSAGKLSPQDEAAQFLQGFK